MIHFHNLSKIKETEGNIIEINNFISKKEISKLNDYVKSAKNIWIDRDDGKKYSFNVVNNNSFPVCDIELWDDLFKQILFTKLKKIFKKVNFYVDKDEFPPHIFKSFYPLKPHVDTGKNNSDKIIYKQILIPLKIEPEESEAYTVFFKNRWYGPAANFRSQTAEYDPLEIKDKNGKFVRILNLQHFYDNLEKSTNKEILFNSGCFENTDFLKKKIKSLMNKKRYNITTSEYINKEKKFPKKIYDKYLTHADINDFHGLDYWKSIKWKCGNAIVWDRTILHASNDFIKSNVNSKIGLSIFFNRR